MGRGRRAQRIAAAASPVAAIHERTGPFAKRHCCIEARGSPLDGRHAALAPLRHRFRLPRGPLGPKFARLAPPRAARSLNATVPVRQVAVALAFNTEREVAATEAVAGVNAKDRHVASAALAAGANFVVTNDRRLRRQVDGIGEPLRALSADEFMVRLYRDQPDRLVGVLDAMVAKRIRRPIAPSELVNALKSSFPQLVNRLTEAGLADP